MTKMKNSIWIVLMCLWIFNSCISESPRTRINFGENWKFHLGDIADAGDLEFDDTDWRELNLPHDWSIEGDFHSSHPATAGGGALPGGIGWYRKEFRVSDKDKEKLHSIVFDGVYRDSRVWINGVLLGRRPNGYVSFHYDLTPYLRYGDSINILAVKVDNSLQPNSRWYSGSGIYRNVWLVKTEKIHVDHWGTFITTPHVTEKTARIEITTILQNASESDEPVTIITAITNPGGKKIASLSTDTLLPAFSTLEILQTKDIMLPQLWSLESPLLYKTESIVKSGKSITDKYITPFGIRYFEFDSDKGFSLNGKHVKIKGVCNHHDLGCLGAAINTRALERQLEILQDMGCNAIRTAHNPPAPELLDLCDRMGFLVMNEAFDIWKITKSPYDYGIFWDEWWKKDLGDFMVRDRNHPSVIVWSIGNEIMEQWDTTGIRMVKEVYDFAKSIDATRPVTTANNPPSEWNNLTKPMIVDLIGYNYAHQEYEKFPELFPKQKFIATETTSALATRGYYDMPSDSIMRWPYRWDIPFTDGNPDNTVSAYDHVSTPWGTTHEESWKIIKKHDFLSGLFIWTGFDYLGEPTPYDWPSRSSYFGIIDLAGFPKDSYYMYKSEWTSEPVLHIFPHWNWKPDDIVDVWAYFNCEEVELFLNGESMGNKQKQHDDLHVMWRLEYVPGTLKAVGRTRGKEILSKEIHTAGQPSAIRLSADRSTLSADGNDLSFVSVEILDADGNLVPYADNLVRFTIKGDAQIAGVDNGSQTSHEPFKADFRKAFNGKCLVVVQAGRKAGEVVLTANSEEIAGSQIVLRTK